MRKYALPWLILVLAGALLVFFSSTLAVWSAALYSLASKPFGWFAEPINNLRLGLGIPLLGAFLLGMLGALAPCQLSTNAAAIAWFSRDTQRPAWPTVGLFLVGKALVYLILAGIALWVFGGSFTAPGAFFAGIRKLLGPLMVLLGLMLLGWLRLPGPTLLTGKLGAWAEARGGRMGAFALGAAFGLAFCPTMFWLYFGLMLPTAVASSGGFLFPLLFALGTAIPVLAVLSILNQGKSKGRVLGEMRQVSRKLNQVAGIVLILVGLYDTVVYWFI